MIFPNLNSLQFHTLPDSTQLAYLMTASSEKVSRKSQEPHLVFSIFDLMAQAESESPAKTFRGVLFPSQAAQMNRGAKGGLIVDRPFLPTLVAGLVRQPASSDYPPVALRARSSS